MGRLVALSPITFHLSVLDLSPLTNHRVSSAIDPALLFLYNACSMKIWINRSGQNLGTFSLEEVQRGLDQGQFVATDLAWQEGMETWKPLAEFPGVRIPSTAAEAPQVYPVTPPPSHEIVSADQPSIAPAWERRPEVKLFPAFFTTIREVLFEPGPTFSRLPINGQLRRPTTFYVMLLVIQYALAYLFYAIYIPFASATNELQRAGVSVGLAEIVLPFALLLLAAMAIGLNFVAAGIFHLILMMLGGANKNYEATYKVLCYSNCAHLLAFVPCVGSIAAIVFFYIASVIGLQKVHGTETWKAAVAMILPGALCCIAIVGSFVFIVLATSHGTSRYSN